MSDQQRLEFVRDVLRSAPAGQFNAMLEDIQTLAGAPLDQALLEEIQKQYESQTCSSRTAAGQLPSHVLAAPLQAAVEEAYANDPSAGDNKEERKDDSATTTTTTTIGRREIIAGENDNTLLFRTYAERVDDAKCRTGYWTAEWKIETTSSDSSEAQVSGQVETCAFSFEDGNVQLRSSQNFDVTTVSGGEDATVLTKTILRQIGVWENQVLQVLVNKDSYTRQLKSIRGILPVTRTRLNWKLVTKRTVRTLQDTVNK